MGNTQTVTGLPAPTVYHRWLGWHALAMRRALTVLTAAGVPGAVAVSAVLLFRLLTFWLPVPFGWAAMSYLEREQAL